ncbi:unnamed protein product [Ectocarpus sp. 8 AP-2014]
MLGGWMFAALPCGPTKHTSEIPHPMDRFSKISTPGLWHLQLEHHLGTPGYNHASHALTNSSGREVDRDEQPQLLELEAGGLLLGRRQPPSLVFRLRTGGRRIVFSSNRQSIYLRSLQGEGGGMGMASEVLPAYDEAAVPKQSWHLSPGSGPRRVLTL